jgi:hypothetical protein
VRQSIISADARRRRSSSLGRLGAAGADGVLAVGVCPEGFTFNKN